MRSLILLTALVGCQAGDAPAESIADSAPPWDAPVESIEADDLAAEPLAAVSASAPARAEMATEAAGAAVEPAPPLADRPAISPDAVAQDAALTSRLLRRSADLRVTTEAFDETLREARAVAGRYGGLIAGENGSAYDDGQAQSTLTLRVPSDRFDAALDALAALGTVESRSVSVDDVTGQIVDVEARLRAQRAAEARYVAFLAEAGSINEMLSVQERLDRVRADIESMESVARSLRGQVALATIRATFVGPATVPAPPPAPGVVARVVDAIALGWHGLLAVVLGVLPLWPLALIAAASVLAWRRYGPLWKRTPSAG
ncbi:DUF4349 domain-containing protein [Rubrivirga marina]|uniref:DUF4349 domain-containing protein n=1 Tax=Rubrivirga marina TaxID=1196024 RepID=A0A271J000_9BACT|nr:DUF4349 domain-containing protein [Rubrivirga marina]PAP76812.1 hypothetical protein BSZ37_10390 [Rubrivirga marina]